MSVTQDEQAILRRVEDLADELAGLISRLVRIPTVNPYCGDASAAVETEGQELFAAEMVAAGAEVQRVPVPADVYARGGVRGPSERSWEGRYCVVGRFTLGSGEGRTLLLNSHMDTVGTDGYETDPFSGEVRDGRVWGVGAGDAKGTLAGGLIAARALAGCGATVNGTIILESVVDEECNGMGAGTLACRLAGVTADAAIALDGSGRKVYTGCTGVITPRITVLGRSGHAARGAVNAIDKLLAVKAALDRLRDERQAMTPPRPVNIGVIRSGNHPANVPHTAVMEYNMVYTIDEVEDPARPGQALIDRVERIVAEVADGDDWLREHRPRIEWMKDAPPYKVPEDLEIVRTAHGAYADVLGEDSPSYDLAWGDASHIWHIGGIPVAGMGGAGGTAHSTNEYVELAPLLDNTKAVALAAHRFLSGS